jgi:hypothetical protein
VPCVGEDDGRLRRTDPTTVGELDPEAVGAQVEPGAGPDLHETQRPCIGGGHSQQATDQRCCPAHLVGLRRLAEAGPKLVGELGEDRSQRGPGGLRVTGAAYRGIGER